jgi:flagellar hook assembly protein FlgD
MSDFGEVGVAELPKGITPIGQFILHQNVPNPFTVQTSIGYQLSSATDLRLNIYNIAGQLVRTLVDTHQDAGFYNVVWSGLDDQGRGVSNGVYFCRLESKDESLIKKMTILR